MDPSIVLTALTEADADFIAQLAADKRITAYIGDGQPWSDQYTGQRIEDAINSPEISWFVARRDGIRVGLFTAVQREQATEIGYWIAPEFWGQGLAKAIVALGIKALNAVGFSQLMARDAGKQSVAQGTTTPWVRGPRRHCRANYDATKRRLVAAIK